MLLTHHQRLRYAPESSPAFQQCRQVSPGLSIIEFAEGWIESNRLALSANDGQARPFGLELRVCACSCFLGGTGRSSATLCTDRSLPVS